MIIWKLKICINNLTFQEYTNDTDLKKIDAFLNARFEKKGLPNVIVEGEFQFNTTDLSFDLDDHFDIEV